MCMCTYFVSFRASWSSWASRSFGSLISWGSTHTLVSLGATGSLRASCSGSANLSINTRRSLHQTYRYVYSIISMYAHACVYLSSSIALRSRGSLWSLIIRECESVMQMLTHIINIRTLRYKSIYS